MLRYLYSDELHLFPTLRDTMFTDRTRAFRDRLGWPVTVDDRGFECDEYDALNPLYVIWQGRDGRHQGSLRFLPTIGRTMLNDHFGHISPRRIKAVTVWECTRFCLADTAEPTVSAALLLGGAEVGLGFGLSHAVGLFQSKMRRVYRMLGWAPDIIGAHGEGIDEICVGLWSFAEDPRAHLARKAGLSPEISARWFERAFGPRPDLAASA